VACNLNCKSAAGTTIKRRAKTVNINIYIYTAAGDAVHLRFWGVRERARPLGSDGTAVTERWNYYIINIITFQRASKTDASAHTLYDITISLNVYIYVYSVFLYTRIIYYYIVFYNEYARKSHHRVRMYCMPAKG